MKKNPSPLRGEGEGGGDLRDGGFIKRGENGDGR
jgi:hypothetical protein